jgi:hypothetical protein
MTIADRNSWTMTGSILKSMKPELKNFGALKDIGLRNHHSYTVLDIKEIILDNGDLEYLVFLRNPSGNFFLKDDEIFSGDWGPLSKKWTPKTRK